MLTVKVAQRIKQETEASWDGGGYSTARNSEIQKGNKWCPGLSEEEIRAYEFELALDFPNDFRTLLSQMNGWTHEIGITDQGRVVLHEPGFYSFPKDLEIVKSLIKLVRGDLKTVKAILPDKVASKKSINFIPILEDAFVVCTEDPAISTVITYEKYANEWYAKLYTHDLEKFLHKELLPWKKF